MTPAEVRELSEVELAQKVNTLRQQLFQLRVQARLGRLEKGHELEAVRRDIARCLTRERQLRPQMGGKP